MTSPGEIKTIGIVGLGLMGQGMASCFIRYGFDVIANSNSIAEEQETINHISESLEILIEKNIIDKSDTEGWKERFKYVSSIEQMQDCQFVIETVGESLDLKRDIYKAVENAVEKDVVIATNTSGISISLLQQHLAHKERFIGMHWGEPAEISKYMEISQAEDTADFAVEIGRSIGERCGKHPTVLNYDIAGLISNRLMYAMMREAMYLVEIGVADVETVDRSFRQDIGWWSTIAGPFRWMDLTGLPLYAKVMEGLFPKLNKLDKVPDLIKEKVDTNTKFYNYSKDSEEEWENVWKDFTYDISKIVDKYEKRVKL